MKYHYSSFSSRALAAFILCVIIVILWAAGIFNNKQLIDFLKTGLIFGTVLSILVFVHELGHFLVALLVGVKVEEFGFGIPPRAKLIKKLRIGKNLVDLTLNWLPIGGFVRLAGEDEDENTIEERLSKHKGKNVQEYFWARTKLERAAILVAGVTMNFLLAVLITTGLLIYGIEEPLQQVKITEVLKNSPAEAAGILPQDRIKAIIVESPDKGSLTIPTRLPQELSENTRKYLGQEITLVILRNNENMNISLIPRKEFPQGEGPIGVKIDFDVQKMKYSLLAAPVKAVELNITRGKDMLFALATLPKRALQGQNVQNEIAGPLGIAQVTGQAAKIGLEAVLNLMSILSLSLAILNLMPIPALDGGRLLFIIIEAITGKRVHQGMERTAHQIGMLLLLGFIAFVTLNDVTRIFSR